MSSRRERPVGIRPLRYPERILTAGQGPWSSRELLRSQAFPCPAVGAGTRLLAGAASRGLLLGGFRPRGETSKTDSNSCKESCRDRFLRPRVPVFWQSWHAIPMLRRVTVRWHQTQVEPPFANEGSGRLGRPTMHSPTVPSTNGSRPVMRANNAESPEPTPHAASPSSVAAKYRV